MGKPPGDGDESALGWRGRWEARKQARQIQRAADRAPKSGGNGKSAGGKGGMKGGKGGMKGGKGKGGKSTAGSSQTTQRPTGRARPDSHVRSDGGGAGGSHPPDSGESKTI